MDYHFKDEILNQLAERANIAQFVSYAPTGEQRFLRINGVDPNTQMLSQVAAISQLIEKSAEHRVNVRSFLPDQPKGHPFAYGLSNVKDVLSTIEINANENRFSIVNETIDTSDGGVSGVLFGNILEFVPDDTPKGVDKPDVCSLPTDLGLSLLETIYGFTPIIDFAPNIRVEFSLHPVRRGIRQEKIIIWELEEFAESPRQAALTWPNQFSRHIGDKVFGLLIADWFKLPVPKTLVISRRVAPFQFGLETGIPEIWTRTAPFTRTPGKFTTQFGWLDPFKLLATEDPEQNEIASVLCQQAVEAIYSGSLVTTESDKPYVEGRRGRGDTFMVGTEGVEQLPDEVVVKVTDLFTTVFQKLGPIEMEWVFDGQTAWIVQLHKSQRFDVNNLIIVEGRASHYINFLVIDGLEKLRSLIKDVEGKNIGIKLIGNVGITSHFGDLLRRSKIPSFIERN
ncbi:hypothetical protein GCM10027299_39610 [Larkinella ripae]